MAQEFTLQIADDIPCDVARLVRELGHRLSSSAEGAQAIACARDPQRFALQRRPIVVITEHCHDIQADTFLRQSLEARRLFLVTPCRAQWHYARRYTGLPWIYYPFLGEEEPAGEPHQQIFCADPQRLPPDVQTTAQGRAADAAAVISFEQEHSLCALYQAGVPLLCAHARDSGAFDPGVLDGVEYFTSLEELRRLLLQSDWPSLRRRIQVGAARRKAEALQIWASLCVQLADSAGRDTKHAFLVRALGAQPAPAAQARLAKVLEDERNESAWFHWRQAPPLERKAALLARALELIAKRQPCCALSYLRELESEWPEDWQAHYWLTAAQIATRNPGAAQASLTRATQLARTSGESFQCLERQLEIYERFGQWKDLESALSQTEVLPEGIPALGLRLTLLVRQGKYQEILELTRSEPVGSKWLFHRAIAFLALGDFDQGWTLYETRDLPVPPLYPRWNGESLAGKTLLIERDQGVGDLFMLARFFAPLKSAGARVVVHCPCSTVGLLNSVEGVAWATARVCGPLECDLSLPLMSLPRLLGLTVDQLPAQIGYIRAPASRLEEWSSRLAAGRPRVGLAWAGNPDHSNDALRSIQLDLLRPIWECPGISFYSLQVGAASSQLRQAHGRIIDLEPWLSDFSETAAAISQLDLVICVDSAVAHLAGAMNKPCWLLTGPGMEWRWRLQENTSPWYPSLRLWRCGHDWQGVNEVSRELRQGFLFKHQEPPAL